MTRKRPKKVDPPKDFPKKKKKVGKGKNIPDNATVVSFKSKSVVIPAQLAKTDGPTTHRKLSLQSLLGQTGHYKPTVRCEALNGIRELLQDNQQLFSSNFSKILLRVLPLMTDHAVQVRHAFCALFKYLLTCATLENVHPFVSIIVAHLVCGLTHLREEIQFDSLKVFDLLLTHFPNLLVPSVHELLPLLMRLISRQKQASEALAAPHGSGRKGILGTIQKSRVSKGDFSSGSALASSPGSKLSKQESRMKIFTQISSLVEVILSSPDLAYPVKERRHQPSPVIDVENRRTFLVSDDGSCTEAATSLCNFATLIPQVVILKHHGVLPPKDALLHPPTAQRGLHNDGNLFPDGKKFVEFVDSLLILLTESWVECSPADAFRNEGNTYSKGNRKSQALPFMETILNTMCSILKLANQSESKRANDSSGKAIHICSQMDASLIHEVREKFWGELKTHLISHFPFSLPVASSQNSSPHLSRVISMDFVLCHIMLLLHPCPVHRVPTDVALKTSEITNMADLVHKFFVQLEENSMRAYIASVPNAILTLAAFLPMLIELCQSSGLTREKQANMFESIMSIYRACHPLSSSRQLLVKSFDERLKFTLEKHEDGTSALLFSELLFPWIQHLPDQLIQLGNSSPKTSSIIIGSIALTAMHMKTSMHMAAVLHASVNSLFSSESVLDHLPTFVQRKAVELLWHLPLTVMTSTLLSKVASCVNSRRCGCDTLRYLVQVVHHRFCDQSLPSVHLSAPLYLSFMLSVIVGYSSADLKDIVSQQQGTLNIKKPRNVEDTDFSASVKIIECACSYLRSSPLSSVLLKVLKKALSDILCESKFLPLDAAFGVLKLCNSCLASSSDSVIPDALISGFTQLCLATLVAMEDLLPPLPHTLAPVHPLGPVCSKEIENLLRASDVLLKELLLEVQKNTTGYDAEKLITVFIWLLKQPSLASSLRKQREDVLTTSMQFSSLSSHKADLDVALTMFRC